MNIFRKIGLILFFICFISLCSAGVVHAAEYAYIGTSSSSAHEVQAVELSSGNITNISVTSTVYNVNNMCVDPITGVVRFLGQTSTDDKIIVIDQQTGTVDALFTGGYGSSTGNHIIVSKDGEKYYAVEQASTTGHIDVFWTLNNTLIGTITSANLDYCRGLDISSDGNKMYITAAANYIYIINLTSSATGTYESQMHNTYGSTYDVIFSPTTDRAYAAAYAGSYIVVINTTSDTIITGVPVLYQDYCIQISSDGSMVYAGTSNGVTVMDTSTNAIVTNIAIGSSIVGVDFNAAGTLLYAHSASSDTIYVIDVSTNSVVDTIPGLISSSYTFGHDFITNGAVGASFTADVTSGYAPLTVNFTDTSFGNISDYYWEFGDGYTSASESPSHTYTSGGIYSVNHSVSDGVATDWENKTNYITVVGSGGGGSVTADFHANTTSTGVGNQVQFFDDSAGSPDSWEWDFTNDGIIDSTAESPIVTYGTIGTFSVALTVYNGTDADSTTKYNYITITSGGPGCLGCEFSANVTTGQYPLTVQFADLSTGSPDEWSWNFGDGSSSIEQNPVHTYTSAGTYTVTFTASALNGTYSKTKVKNNYITVSEPTIAGTDFTANVTYGTAPLTVLFTDTSTGNPTSWTWEIDDVYQTDTQDMTVTFNDAGIYSITHTATNAEGTGTETKTNYIQVYPANYGGIYGYVFDADTNEPISSVNCQLSNSSATAAILSDSDGYYYFWPVYNGVYDLTVSKSGYTTGSLPNTIINGTTLRQDIYLTQSGDIVQDENITNYSSDWLSFDLTTDADTKTITLDYEVTQGNTNYANCTIYDDSGPVYSSNVSTQSGTFSYTGSAGNNYLVSFDIMNDEGNRYSGAYPVLFFRGFPSSNPIFPPDMPRGIINGILVFAAIVCMMMFGKAYIEIGMILGTAVLASSYIWGFLNLPETVQTPVIIFLSALVAGGEYIAKKKVLG
ncbi:PKD domain-containing protein [Methanosarcina acetivorans]|uniref:Cell surface protein n=1 Tax=Methanosarcina acetivorans (strain ATCC 35395 / DSM 2834 / JCM 12185 / C2A) TaxID=188937 RepID=Q8TL14_METAC|nr:PKD domain-containing protein [Methanosarcina acetivorans]AAM06600.1 cell surface protein [Methanosarcina acetivorans C2A]